ncbi:hypothetical protein KAI58_02465 [Candidatus Gracilibacteria bacterium]|nr:hypothetical protein [Candidatus Gracilibacteria bacterium]
MDLNTKVEIDFSKLMTRVLSLLSDKERDVIQRRFSLDGRKKETLDGIGKGYQITRERVRQIEAVALKKLARISMDPSMRKIHDLAFGILSSHGCVMSEDHLISEMLKNMLETKNIDVNAMKLAMRVSNQMIKQEKNQFFRAFWRTSEMKLLEVKNCIKAVQKSMQKKKVVMDVNTLASVLAENFSAEIIASVLHIDWGFKETEDGWGLTSWRHINPRSIKDKVMIIFKDTGKPMHFTDIVNHVLKGFSAKKMVTHQAIHNELIRHDDFVLVGRGIYALNEWGLPSGTVCDLIKSVLEENGGPMKRQEIITAVLKKRDIRIGTISLNLQKYPFFKRVGRAVYGYETTLDNRKRNK